MLTYNLLYAILFLQCQHIVEPGFIYMYRYMYILDELYCVALMFSAIIYCTVNKSAYNILEPGYIYTHIYIIIHLPLIYLYIVILRYVICFK